MDRWFCLLPTGIIEMEVVDLLCCATRAFVIGCNVIRMKVAWGRAEYEEDMRERMHSSEEKNLCARLADAGCGS